MSIIATGDRVWVHPNLHDPSIPSGRGTVTRTYVQTDPHRDPGWQHVFSVRLDSGQTVDAPSRFVSVKEEVTD